MRGISAAVEGVIEGVPAWTGWIHGTASSRLCAGAVGVATRRVPALPEVDHGDRTGRGRSTGAESRIWNPSQSDHQLKRKNAAATVYGPPLQFEFKWTYHAPTGFAGIQGCERVAGYRKVAQRRRGKSEVA